MKYLRGEKVAGSGGFTLVEIVVTIIVMTIVIYPIMRVMASALEESNDEEYLTHAAFLAQLKIEEVRSRASCYTDYGAAPVNGCPMSGTTSDFGRLNPAAAPTLTENAAACSFPYPFQKYECTVDTGLVPGTNDALGYIQVRVWYDKDSNGTLDPKDPDVFLETQIAKRPPDW